jgi:hypothetical protein
MTSINQDFTLYSGDDKTIVVTITNSSGQIVNLTGLTAAQFVAKKYSKSSSVDVTKTLGAGITNAAPTTGKLTITLDAADTSGLTPGEYYVEVRIKDSASRLGTVSVGTMTLKQADSL